MVSYISSQSVLTNEGDATSERNSLWYFKKATMCVCSRLLSVLEKDSTSTGLKGGFSKGDTYLNLMFFQEL